MLKSREYAYDFKNLCRILDIKADPDEKNRSHILAKQIINFMQDYLGFTREKTWNLNTLEWTCILKKDVKITCTIQKGDPSPSWYFPNNTKKARNNTSMIIYLYRKYINHLDVTGLKHV